MFFWGGGLYGFFLGFGFGFCFVSFVCFLTWNGCGPLVVGRYCT